MKTIEERAILNLQYEKDFLGRNLSDNMVCRAYVVGATEQREIDIEKFEKWYCKKKCYRRKECLIPMNICARLGKIEKEVFDYEND